MDLDLLPVGERAHRRRGEHGRWRHRGGIEPERDVGDDKRVVEGRTRITHVADRVGAAGGTARMITPPSSFVVTSRCTRSDVWISPFASAVRRFNGEKESVHDDVRGSIGGALRDEDALPGREAGAVHVHHRPVGQAELR